MATLTHEDAVTALTLDTSYPEQIGWFKSYMSRTPIDRNDQPLPWYTYAASYFIGARLTKDMQVYEFGAGFSTRWYAARTKSVISVEHNQKWIQIKIGDKLPANAELHILEEGPYAKDILQYSNKFDIVCVDGIERVNCSLNIMGAIKDDGVVVWDNSNSSAYAEGYKFLASHGFRRIDFHGFIPICLGAGCTSVFYRPNNVFNI